MWVEFEIQGSDETPTSGEPVDFVDLLVRFEADNTFTDLGNPAIIDQNFGWYGFEINDADLVPGTTIGWRVDGKTIGTNGSKWISRTIPINDPNCIAAFLYAWASMHPDLPLVGESPTIDVCRKVAPNGAVSSVSIPGTIYTTDGFYACRVDGSERDPVDAILTWQMSVLGGVDTRYVWGTSWGPESLHLGGAAGGGEFDGGTPPVISGVLPEPPGPLSSGTPWQATITGELAELLIFVSYADLPVVEVVYDGAAFTQNFSGASTIEVVGSDTNLYIKRGGGWPGAPRFAIRARSTDGGVNE